MDSDEFKKLQKRDEKLYFWILLVVAVIILSWLFYINNIDFNSANDSSVEKVESVYKYSKGIYQELSTWQNTWNQWCG